MRRALKAWAGQGPKGVVSFLLLLAFALTEPGLGGLELAAHLTGVVDLAHARQAHYEAAGHTSHADECQLGVAAATARTRDMSVPSVAVQMVDVACPVPDHVSPPRPPALRHAYPRAPPA